MAVQEALAATRRRRRRPTSAWRRCRPAGASEITQQGHRSPSSSSSSLIAIYISIRFEWRMAVAAILAMLHDVVIIVGIYSVFGFEVTPPTVIAFLTDPRLLALRHHRRVRPGEGERATRRGRRAVAPPTWSTCRSNQVLLRSLNTSLSAIAAGDLAARHRRRDARPGDAAGVRHRPARRHAHRRLLVDLHRHADARHAQGTRANRIAARQRRPPRRRRPAPRRRARRRRARRRATGRRRRSASSRRAAVAVGAPPAPATSRQVRAAVPRPLDRRPPARPPSSCSATRRARARRSGTSAASGRSAGGRWPGSAARSGLYPGSMTCLGRAHDPTGPLATDRARPRHRRLPAARRHVPRHHAAARRRRRRSGAAIDDLGRPLRRRRASTGCVGVEARGFILAAPVAYRLGAGFVPVRKAGKLPWAVAREEYELEYGTDKLEIHRDAIHPGERVLIIDDVLATGGTAAATARLVETLGGEIVGLGFLIELADLGGRARLGRVPRRVPGPSTGTVHGHRRPGPALAAAPRVGHAGRADAAARRATAAATRRRPSR